MNLARDGLTDSQVRDALHGRNGIQMYRFRYELQRDGARVRDLNVTEGTVSLDRTDAIQRGADLVIYDSGIDWLKNTIKIFMGLRVRDRWLEWPLGVFIPSTPKKVTDGVRRIKQYDATPHPYSFFDEPWTESEQMTWREIDAGVSRKRKLLSATLTETAHYEVECYDRTVILKEDAFVDRYFIPATTKYLHAVQAILVTAGIEQVIVTKTVDTEIPVDREWDIGVTKLEIINMLLEEINYNPIFCDADGNMVISPYVEPGTAIPNYQYAADEMSVIASEMATTQDFYGVANVFIAVSSNPDLKQDFRAVYINDDPASPFSTVQRGRTIVAKPYQLDAVASQAELDAYVRKQAFEASQVYEEIEFTTALMPFHGSGDILSLNHPAAQGLYQEMSWELELAADGQMTHTARKVISL